MELAYGPQTEAGDNLHQMKYRGDGESFRESVNRLASTLSDNDSHFHRLQDIFGTQSFLPAGRVQAAIGSTRNVTALNCYVSPKIEDSYVDGENSIMDVAKKAAATMRMGGGIGYDFCLSPGTKIIKTDLTWVDVETLKEGDKVIGFPEQLDLSKGLFQEAVVEKNYEVTQLRVIINTDQGSVSVSNEHKFVVLRKEDFPHKHKGQGYKWVDAKDILPGDKIAFTKAPWTEDELDPYDAGWLSGLLDGEGWVSHSEGVDGKGHAGFGQNPGAVLDKALSLLNKYKFNYVVYTPKHTHYQVRSVRFKGKWEALKLLSQTKPVRLFPKVEFLWKGSKLSTKTNKPAIVSSVQNIGEGIVWAVRTSTQTLIANGFLSHNSPLRPKGDLIKKLDSHSSGPISFMNIFNEICLCTSSAGHRRGAQMGSLLVSHPDIEEFIHAKQDNRSLTGFNISVAVTDKFMKAVEDDTEFPLEFNGQVYRTIQARNLWETLMRSTYDWAEPGIIFIDTVNHWNNLKWIEDIKTCNPCGEQFLPPNGACLLGSFNLVKYLNRTGLFVYDFDWDRFTSDIPDVVRAMDNIIDCTRYPLPEQEQEEKGKRRMGLGVTGLANCIEAMGYSYGSPEFIHVETQILCVLRNQCYWASVQLAKEKGSFEAYNSILYSRGEFIKQLPKELQFQIANYGIRNSHLTSIAPTGTISMAADNVSSGLEPVFSYSTRRVIQTPGGPKEVVIEDYGSKFLGIRGKLASKVTADEHLNVLVTAQKYVDSAVSKTVNMDGSMPWSDFKNLYMKAWKLGAKGLSTFNQDGKRTALLVASSENEAQCKIDLETGRKECA